MKRWQARLTRAGSLRRFLMVWMLGGLWLVVAAATVWQFALAYRQLAHAQDEQLRAALAEVAQDIERERTLAVDEPLRTWRESLGDMRVGRTAFRVSAMGGEWLAGDQGFALYPWRGTLDAAGTPQTYWTHIRGTLVRAAVAVRHLSSERGAVGVVVQAASPLRDRLPGWHLLFTAPLALLYVVAALASVVLWVGVELAMRWLERARLAMAAPQGTAYDGPQELGVAVTQMQGLLASQQQWVDEQRRFMADASHQLRTPMAVLRTQLQAAMAGDIDPAVVMPQMLHTVDRAAGVANQLLSLAKIEQLRRQGQLQTIDLSLVARDTVRELSPLIATKRLDFSLEGPALQAPADTVMMGELLRNLLANALHHAPHGGRLGILMRNGGGRAEVIVWDEGPGLDSAVQQRLFQPFSASRGGVGLGLSICRQIAEAMGASIAIYDRIEGDRVVGVDAVVSWRQGP